MSKVVSRRLLTTTLLSRRMGPLALNIYEIGSSVFVSVTRRGGSGILQSVNMEIKPVGPTIIALCSDAGVALSRPGEEAAHA